MSDLNSLNGDPAANHQPPTTDSRAVANRANARLSTGPRTAAGKQSSKLNALRHGLTGHTIVLPSEDHAAYQRHVQSFTDEYQPKGATEQHLVQSIADTAWRLNRIPALETNLLTLGIVDHAAALSVDHPQAHDALAMAAAFRENTRAFAALSMHGHRLSRQFERALQQLRALQAQRRETEEQQLKDAGNLLEMHQDNNLPYSPAEDGFVFSNQEIQSFLRKRNREDQALRAKVERPYSPARTLAPAN
jgi:hypothetical protein